MNFIAIILEKINTYLLLKQKIFNTFANQMANILHKFINQVYIATIANEMRALLQKKRIP